VEDPREMERLPVLRRLEPSGIEAKLTASGAA